MNKKTLILHLQDESTDFLKPIYQNIENKKVYTQSIYVDEILEEADNYDRLIFLGHGYPDGLLGWKKLFIDPKFIEIIRNKGDQVIYIWCHASDYVRKYNLSGFATGMFISEVGEAEWYDIEATQDEIDYSNDLFVECVKKYIDLHPEWKMIDMKNEVYSGYSDYNDKVIKYNQQRLVYLNNVGKSNNYKNNLFMTMKSNDRIVESFSGFLKMNESSETLETPQIDKKLERRQQKELKLKDYKEQASSLIKGRDIDIYDFDDKMYDAFMRGQDPKDFARNYILDNEL